MTGIINEPYLPNRALEQLGLDAYSSGIAAGTAYEQARSLNPVTLWGNAVERSPGYQSAYEQALRERLGEGYNAGPTIGGVPATPTVKVLTPEDATAKWGIKGELAFDRPIPEPAAEQLHRLKTEEMQRRGVLMRARQDFLAGAVRFGAGFAAAALDPINVASAFIPVVSEARYGIWAAKYGPMAARALRGGIEGAAGQAMIEPFVYLGARANQADYSAMDSFLNIVVGGALGGGLHMGGGWLADRLAGRALPAIPAAIEAAPMQARETALRGAVAAVAEGRPVRVAELLPEIAPRSPAEAEFDRLFSGATAVKAADDLTAGGGLLGAPPAQPFDLGTATGAGASEGRGRYAAYTPVSPGDRPWLEGIAAEVKAAQEGAKVIDAEGRWLASAADFARHGEQTGITFNPSTFPKWFTDMNAAGEKVTREKVAAVAAKLLAGEPLGIHEGRIAKAMMAEARALREQNVGQMVAARAARQAAQLRELDRIANDTVPWEQPEDRAAAAAVAERVQPTLRQSAPDAAATQEQQLTQEIADLEAQLAPEEKSALAEAAAAADKEAPAVDPKVFDAAASCLTGVL